MNYLLPAPGMRKKGEEGRPCRARGRVKKGEGGLSGETSGGDSTRPKKEMYKGKEKGD